MVRCMSEALEQVLRLSCREVTWMVGSSLPVPPPQNVVRSLACLSQSRKTQGFPRRKIATTCPSRHHPLCTPRARISAHLPLGQRQGAGLLPGIPAWISQAAHLREREVSISSRRYWSPPCAFSKRATNDRRRQRAPTRTGRAHHHHGLHEQCVHASSMLRKTLKNQQVGLQLISALAS